MTIEKWNNMDKKIPEDKQRVLVWDEIFNVVLIGCYNLGYNSFQEEDEYGDFIDGHPYYWMPLPKNPKG